MIHPRRTRHPRSNATSPLGADYIPPPEDAVPGLVDDLVSFMARDDIPPIAMAAIAHAQLETIHPRHIIALGGTAAKYLLGVNRPMNRLRGRFYEHPSGARLLPTFHPAYLLRNPNAKRDVWEDVQMVMAETNEQTEEKE